MAHTVNQSAPLTFGHSAAKNYVLFCITDTILTNCVHIPKATT